MALSSKVTRWAWQMFQQTGPEADCLRARALPLIAQDPTRVPDTLFSGPDFPLRPNARARFFGEDFHASACLPAPGVVFGGGGADFPVGRGQ